mgnify:CR=1 FL=1
MTGEMRKRILEPLYAASDHVEVLRQLFEAKSKVDDDMAFWDGLARICENVAELVGQPIDALDKVTGDDPVEPFQAVN